MKVGRIFGGAILKNLGNYNDRCEDPSSQKCRIKSETPRKNQVGIRESEGDPKTGVKGY